MNRLSERFFRCLQMVFCWMHWKFRVLEEIPLLRIVNTAHGDEKSRPESRFIFRGIEICYENHQKKSQLSSFILSGGKMCLGSRHSPPKWPQISRQVMQRVVLNRNFWCFLWTKNYQKLLKSTKIPLLSRYSSVRLLEIDFQDVLIIWQLPK